MSTYNDKTDVILVFNCDIREPITTAAETNYDDEGYGLIKAASILRIQELLENILNDSFSSCTARFQCDSMKNLIFCISK